MKIRWTAEAAAGLEQISDYIAEDNPDRALSTIRSIFSRIEELTNFPLRGRTGREHGTREFVLSPLPYIAVYRVTDNSVEILHVRHGPRWRLSHSAGSVAET